MTHITFFKKGDIYTGFILEGHAGHNDGEYDMVCTAISVLATTTINAIESVAGISPIYDIIDDINGIMHISLPDGVCDTSMHDAQVIIKTMIQGLKDIKQEFPEYINLEA